jgi:hypothetical protein
MANEESRFMASSDCCGFCDALDGERVPSGFKLHPGCTCSTHVTKVEEELGDCTWSFELAGSTGSMQGIEVTVTCPDGSEIGSSFEVDTGPFMHSGGAGVDPLAEGLLDAAEDMAGELCAECH